MDSAQLYLETITRADETLKRALDGLTADDLRRQVAGPDSNPIGWLVWHLTRTRDTITANFSGTPTLWESAWATRFEMDPSPPRFEPQNVHTFDPKDMDTLMGYYNAVAQHSAELVRKLTDEDLERMVQPTAPGRPPMSVSSRLSVILNDNIQHIGQVAYLRGLLREQGWL